MRRDEKGIETLILCVFFPPNPVVLMQDSQGYSLKAHLKT